jgi:hypothetical protein
MCVCIKDEEENYQTIDARIYTRVYSTLRGGERATTMYSRNRSGARGHSRMNIQHAHTYARALRKAQREGKKKEGKEEETKCGCRHKKESKIHRRQLAKRERRERQIDKKKLDVSRLILYSFAS